MIKTYLAVMAIGQRSNLCGCDVVRVTTTVWTVDDVECGLDDATQSVADAKESREWATR